MVISSKGFLRADHVNSLAHDLVRSINDPSTTAFFDFNIDILAGANIYRGHWSHRDDPAQVTRWFEKYDADMNFLEENGSEFGDQLNAFIKPSQYVNLEPKPNLNISLLESSVELKPALSVMKIWFSWLPEDTTGGASILHDRVFVQFEDDAHAMQYALGPNGHLIDRDSVLPLEEW